MLPFFPAVTAGSAPWVPQAPCGRAPEHRGGKSSGLPTGNLGWTPVLTASCASCGALGTCLTLSAFLPRICPWDRVGPGRPRRTDTSLHLQHPRRAPLGACHPSLELHLPRPWSIEGGYVCDHFLRYCSFLTKKRKKKSDDYTKIIPVS